MPPTPVFPPAQKDGRCPGGGFRPNRIWGPSKLLSGFQISPHPSIQSGFQTSGRIHQNQETDMGGGSHLGPHNRKVDGTNIIFAQAPNSEMSGGVRDKNVF